MAQRWLIAAPLLALASVGCSEAASQERAQLEQAQRSVWERDNKIRALEWQLTATWQEKQAADQRHDAALRELNERVLQLSSSNAALVERLRQADAKPMFPPDDPNAKKTPGHLSNADLRRVEALIDEKNKPVNEALRRIERQMNERAKGEQRQGRQVVDVLDPWGFGERK